MAADRTPAIRATAGVDRGEATDGPFAVDTGGSHERATAGPSTGRSEADS